MEANHILEATVTPASLLDGLHSRDAATAQRAREQLVEMGDSALPYLIGLLSDSSPRARWEAAKALAQLCPPEAAPALVQSLTDDDGGVRWIAAETLARCGPPAIDALFHELLRHSESVWLREGAHHVLTEKQHNGTLPSQARPVLVALEGIEPTVSAMNAAARALDDLHLHRYAG
ncbi:MAG: HEAT repeat domain-containing protein [Dehalococcoidia bacterium]|nr:HEAT repeat domain-containing protein [Dehalococcoidia bacterium]